MGIRDTLNKPAFSDVNGEYSQNGKIVLESAGMSTVAALIEPFQALPDAFSSTCPFGMVLAPQKLLATAPQLVLPPTRSRMSAFLILGRPLRVEAV